MELLVKLWTLDNRHKKKYLLDKLFKRVLQIYSNRWRRQFSYKNAFLTSILQKNNKMQIRSIVFMVRILLYTRSDRISDRNNGFLADKKSNIFQDLTEILSVGILWNLLRLKIEYSLTASVNWSHMIYRSVKGPLKIVIWFQDYQKALLSTPGDPAQNRPVREPSGALVPGPPHP